MPLPPVARPRGGSVAAGPLVSDDGGPPAPRRRRLRWLALAMLVLAGVATAAVVAIESRSHAHRGGGLGVPPGDTTASVERRTLVEHTQVDGTLTYGGSMELYDRLAGTFTWLPAVGAVIRRGEPLFRIDNLPVVLLYGSLPAYRALKEGISDGPDVSELNENLIALGFDPYGSIGTRDHFGAATTAAVKRWQRAAGLPQTGEVELGRVIFAPGERRVTSVHVALGEDPPPAKEEVPADGHSKEAPARGGQKPHHHTAPEHKKGKAHESSPSEGSHPNSDDAANGNGSKEASQHEKDASHEKGGGEKEQDGSGHENENSGSPSAGAPQLALSTTGREQIVELQVKADQQQLAHVGERTTVSLPDGSVVAGHITSVGTVASESSGESEKGANGGGGGGGNNGSGNGENATISATLALYRPVARLDKAPVSVELVKNVRHDVLAAPATALVALSGGGYALQALEGDRRVTVPVTPGMFAGGYVEVEGAGVHAGLAVLEPQ
jgi:peptidoglycan hydrolase-like protein with peptidoglycan-binding domain